jgi:enoyl-CoA hydratase
VIATSGARFGLPECGLGMIPGVAGTQTLGRRIGPGQSLDLVLSGRLIGAAEARRLGVVARVVAERALPAETRRLARRLAALDPDVVVAVRRCLRTAHDGTLAAGIALERRLGLGLEARR